MRVALVHDDLVQWGGAERVLLGLTEIYPGAPIYTSLYDKQNQTLNKEFGSKKIVTSFLQNIPGWKQLYKAMVPLYGMAFEQFDFSDFDLVISHTTRFAKSIITKPGTLHICYCHTPPRFLWRFSGEKNFGFVEPLLSKLRVYDTVSARRVDFYIAGSENAKRRIKKVYNRESKVVYPFIDIDRFKNIERFNGDYFVVLSRSNKYKRVDLAVETCADLGVPLKVVGGFGGNEVGGIEFLGNLDDEMVVNILSGCRALIICGEEDFGLTSLEAQALGKPVIAFKAGGSLETVLEGKTGIFFNEQTMKSLKEAINKLANIQINPIDCKESAARFSTEKFLNNFQAVVASLV